MSQFVDECQLNVRAGDGGAGCVSFRREGPEAMGGPNGGDGGQGGDVWMIADRNVASLLAFRDHPHRIAGNGVHGKGKDLHGRRGEDLIIAVPEGTVARDMYSGEVLADLVNHGDRWMASPGGRGGRGNAKFFNNRRREPTFAEQGEEATERWLKLELKLMADVALVGFPNAGKSTLLSVLSAATPEIADYPFTTLVPQLGVVEYRDEKSFVVADIPGIIEGASEGKGLGLRFLRHIERNSILCFLIPSDAENWGEEYRILTGELEKYNPELLGKRRVIVVSKMDLSIPEMEEEMRESLPKDIPVLLISSVTQEGIQELKDLLWTTLLDENKDFGKLKEAPVLLDLPVVNPMADEMMEDPEALV